MSLNNKTGILYIVSTPIGNLKDISIRALEVLRNVNLIACEDTRKSRILLKHWSIFTSVISLHRFSEVRKSQIVLDRLKKGKDIALITDAGTPAISDPGNRLVRSALDEGIRVVPIPGPSSIIAALSVSGSDCSSFTYLGFVPKKDDQRRSFFRSLAQEKRTCVFFDTPQRIKDTLVIASEILGSRRMIVARELTKIHEEIICGTAQSILNEFSSREAVKGELVIVVEASSQLEPQIEIEQAVRLLIDEGFSGKLLAQEAQARWGIKKTQAYNKYIELKDKK